MSGIILGKKADTVLIHADALFLCVNGKGAVQALRHPELVKNDILNKEDRDNIFRVCLAACSRELAKLKEE